MPLRARDDVMVAMRRATRHVRTVSSEKTNARYQTNGTNR